MHSRHVHLVGSVPLADAATVFATVSAALGPRLKRIPDGETGERSDWIAHLEPVFANNPALEKSDEVFRLHPTAPGRTRYRLRPGLSPADIRFDNLFYADTAIRSYRGVRAAQAAGQDPAAVPLPGRSRAGALGALAVPAGRPACAGRSDLQRGAASARSTGSPRRSRTTSSRSSSTWRRRCSRGCSATSRTPMAATRTRCSTLRRILGEARRTTCPRDIELMFHFCYGDSNHRHVVEPIDMGDMVDVANRAARAGSSGRSICIHMPVPRDRRDDAYFAPLARLGSSRDTELCLGLVHYTDGVAGTRGGSRPRKNMCRISRSRRNAASGGARLIPSPSCCASTPRWRDSARAKVRPAMMADRSTEDVVIRPLRPDERADWEPLWQRLPGVLQDRHPRRAPRR